MICLTCNKSFNSFNKNAKFCSRSCSAKCNNRAKPKRQKTGCIIKCSYCNKENYVVPSLSNTKFCNCDCAAKYKRESIHKQNLNRFNQGMIKDRSIVYQLLVEKDGNKCQICGLTEWNNKPIRLWVDHIDGTASNNMPYNFRLVCPNCDSQSSTFSNRNKGRGRRSLGLKPYG